MELNLDRRQFIVGGSVIAAGAVMAGMTGCSSSNGSGSSAASSAATEEVAAPEKLVFAWEPGASEGKYENMRDLMAESISEGAGVPCETMTTTDYNVCIESVNSGKAHYASLGAKEYVELHKKNPKVEVAWVLSDGEGELNPVSYHSQVLVLEDNSEQYKQADGSYKLTKEQLEGQNYSWVELSSTSGFVIPSISMAKEFGIENPDDLGESGKFFDTVYFGGSHANAMLNVLIGDAGFCSVDDTGLAAYYNVIEGENGELGALYEVKAGLEAPFDEYEGTKLRVVTTYPVPAVPFVVNTEFVPADMNEAVIEYMGSEAVYNNPELFKDPSDKDTVTKYKQTTGKVRFIPAPDSYYDDFRKMIGEE
ncbi:PhnD/SsuA/transferrin family substrate-binding protein [Adlercreutzia sp. ZJ242]|uniref:PhnD/SsuA/transferrin family substrate-binding protein n=1 Tax=Adlercreutzia sp. ZJ242 TaxID=2709409 RepID=UPI0013EC8EF8|nr:PhnD/SsuA/transferrin family substrate-binding protein [Adlercreutzia sp. ZJ242]